MPKIRGIPAPYALSLIEQALKGSTHTKKHELGKEVLAIRDYAEKMGESNGTFFDQFKKDLNQNGNEMLPVKALIAASCDPHSLALKNLL